MFYVQFITSILPILFTLMALLLAGVVQFDSVAGDKTTETSKSLPTSFINTVGLGGTKETLLGLTVVSTLVLKTFSLKF